MKREMYTILIFVAIVIIGLLVGGVISDYKTSKDSASIEVEASTNYEQNRLIAEFDQIEVSVFVDPEVGVEYLVFYNCYDKSIVVTPRLNRDDNVIFRRLN